MSDIEVIENKFINVDLPEIDPETGLPNCNVEGVILSPVNARGVPRARRPEGSVAAGYYYSTDPKTRHQEMVEDGKIGSKGSELAIAQGALGGRPKNKRAQEVIAERVAEKGNKLFKVLEDVMKEGSDRDKINAVKTLLDVEETVIKREEREQERIEGMDRDRVLEMLAEKLKGSGPMAEQLREKMKVAAINSTAEEI